MFSLCLHLSLGLVFRSISSALTGKPLYKRLTRITNSCVCVRVCVSLKGSRPSDLLGVVKVATVVKELRSLPPSSSLFTLPQLDLIILQILSCPLNHALMTHTGRDAAMSRQTINGGAQRRVAPNVRAACAGGSCPHPSLFS